MLALEDAEAEVVIDFWLSVDEDGASRVTFDPLTAWAFRRAAKRGAFRELITVLWLLGLHDRDRPATFDQP